MSLMSLLRLLKLMYLLKSPLDQNLIAIYYKFYSDFKSHIIFLKHKRDMKMACSITQ
jgi:hypothetical protein